MIELHSHDLTFPVDAHLIFVDEVDFWHAHQCPILFARWHLHVYSLNYQINNYMTKFSEFFQVYKI